MSLAVHITAPLTEVNTLEIKSVFSVDVDAPDGLTKLLEGLEGSISIADDEGSLPPEGQ